MKGDRQGEKHPCVVSSCISSTGDLAHNPDMCPDWELNRRPFGLQASTQSADPHQQGLSPYFKRWFYYFVLNCKRVYVLVNK